MVNAVSNLTVSGQLLEHALISTGRLAVALLVATSLVVPLALLMGRSDKVLRGKSARHATHAALRVRADGGRRLDSRSMLDSNKGNSAVDPTFMTIVFMTIEELQ